MKYGDRSFSNGKRIKRWERLGREKKRLKKGINVCMHQLFSRNVDIMHCRDTLIKSKLKLLEHCANPTFSTGKEAITEHRNKHSRQSRSQRWSGVRCVWYNA